MTNKHASLYALFADIADAIREKTGDSDTIAAAQIPNVIRERLEVKQLLPPIGTALNDMTWEEWLDSKYSDGWSYKSQIVTYTGPEENTCSKGAYYPYCLEKEINNNLFLIGRGEYDTYALGLSKGISKVCDNPYQKDCYTESIYVINRKKIIPPVLLQYRGVFTL